MLAVLVMWVQLVMVWTLAVLWVVWVLSALLLMLHRLVRGAQTHKDTRSRLEGRLAWT
jgi:hypothetical protein